MAYWTAFALAALLIAALAVTHGRIVCVEDGNTTTCEVGTK
jgi:hypothetical protein